MDWTNVFAALRALDQGDIETLPDKLERMWEVLLDHPDNGFHPPEEVLLRWLLKNMTGANANAERIRRYPLAWDTLGAVFPRIRLYSLARALADRRFAAVLQQTLKDISKPQQGAAENGVDSDVEMTDAMQEPANPRKRKRSTPTAFDVAAQEGVDGCLQTAEAVFGAIRTLLSLVEAIPLDADPMIRMPGEHIKCLLSGSATVMMEILVPLLTLCNLAASQTDQQSFHGQSTWISTLADVWDLRRRSDTDPTDVAIHLSAQGTTLLGKLMGVPQLSPLGIDVASKGRWASDLKLFLVRNLILPSKAAFLNSKSQENIQFVVQVSSASASQAFPVLFDLLTTHPPNDKAAMRDHEVWVQAAFDTILMASLHFDLRNKTQGAIEAIMQMAAERNSSLSLPSLRSVCKEFALRENDEKWGILLSIVKLNPDVFLISDEGLQLQEQILDKARNPKSLSEEDLERASTFIVLLADGYAKARDLTGFIRVWLKYLSTEDNSSSLWVRTGLSQTVAAVLEQSLNASQLVDILDWLASQTGPLESVARMHILWAISAGIQREEYVDAANMKTVSGALSGRIASKELSATVSTLQWEIAEMALSKATLQEAGQIWNEIKADIERILRKASIRKKETFPAFKCCTAAWLANHPDGPHEDEAASLICSFVEKLGDSKTKTSSKRASEVASKDAYVSWILSQGRRLLSLIVQRTGAIPNLISSTMSPLADEDTRGLKATLAAFSLVIENENNLNKQKLMNPLIDTIISLIKPSKSERGSPSTQAAIQFLLEVPKEVLSRDQRESIMKQLISQLPKKRSKKETVGPEYWRPALRLMVKLMEMPTFYEEMAFSHLEEIGICLLRMDRRIEQTPESLSDERGDLKVLAQLATHSVRQMAYGTIGEREDRYLKDAMTVLQTPPPDSDVVLRLILLRVFLLVLLGSSTPGQLKNRGILLQPLQDSLLNQAASIIESQSQVEGGTLAFLTALEAVGALDKQPVQERLSHIAPSLLKASDMHLKEGVATVGWEIRTFLATYFLETLGDPLNINFPLHIADDGGDGIEIATLLQYIDAVVGDADQDTKLGYLRDLLDQVFNQDTNVSDALGRLSVVHRLTQHIEGPRKTPHSTIYDLAKAHSILCLELEKNIDNVPKFVLMARSIYLLLDQRAAWMGQWNVSVILGKVSVICSMMTSAAQQTDYIQPQGWHKIYYWLCQFVDVILRRHRIRLDGHFHLLIFMFYPLLQNLLSRRSAEHQVAHAKLVSRLLTLICEPTNASVARSQAAGGSLESDKNKAKRYAGHYMHVVVSQYVQLQLEHGVSPEVREALEPGIFSILDITTQGGLNAMNGLMERSGKAVFRELYKRYQRFGKWQGV